MPRLRNARAMRQEMQFQNETTDCFSSLIIGSHHLEPLGLLQALNVSVSKSYTESAVSLDSRHSSAPSSSPPIPFATSLYFFHPLHRATVNLSFPLASMACSSFPPLHRFVYTYVEPWTLRYDVCPLIDTRNSQPRPFLYLPEATPLKSSP